MFDNGTEKLRKRSELFISLFFKKKNKKQIDE